MDVGILDPDARRDMQLMARVCIGQPEALQELYHCYFRRGHALAGRILADSGAAEDCVHDVFLKLWQRPQLYDPRRGTFIHWFLTVVHHQAVNRVRQGRRTQPLPEIGVDTATSGAAHEPGDRPPGQSSVEDRLHQTEVQQVVRAGLARLTAPQRAALELAYFGGMSQSEIAAHLELPLGTVKTRIRTGMIQLRAALTALDAGLDVQTASPYTRRA